MNWSPITPLLSFEPSADPTSPGIITEASNLIPSDRGWRAAYGLNNALSGQLPGTALGGALFQLTNGEYVTVAGINSALYRQTGRAIVETQEVRGHSGTVAFAGVQGVWAFGVGGPQAVAGTPAVVAFTGVQGVVALGDEMAILGTPATLRVTGVAGSVDLREQAVITGSPGVIRIEGVTGEVKLAYFGWQKVSTATYHASPDYRWRFAQMGDYLLAANGSDTIQVSLGGTTFTAVTGAPQANLLESVFGFIMAAGTTDATYGTQPDRWWCSGIFDHTDWTPALETQSTTGRLVDTNGPIRALKRLGSTVVAYKDASMYVGEYVQPPTVWQWRLLSSDVGAPSNDGVVNIGRAHLFMGNRNFFMYDGAQLAPIGDPVREWFFGGELQRAYDERVQSAHDPANALVYWFYPPETSTTGTLSAGVVYNYRVNRWGVVSYPVQVGMEYVVPNITYDTLGTVYAGYDVTGIDRSFDSSAWIEQNVGPAVIATDQRAYTIDGQATTASFVTGHMGDDQHFSLMRRVRIRWLTTPDAARLRLYTTNEHGSEFALRKEALLASNKFDLLASARWHRAEVLTSGEMEFAGMAIDIEKQGAW